jgi:hypothetical protein
LLYSEFRRIEKEIVYQSVQRRDFCHEKTFEITFTKKYSKEFVQVKGNVVTDYCFDTDNNNN